MYVALLLIGINIFTYILPYVIPFKGRYNSFASFLVLGEKDNQAIREGEYYRLLTSSFLHANFLHLFVNMLSLFQLGQSAELFGTFGFAIIYIVSGICSALASFWFNPNPSVGASGAIFGLVGALFCVGLISGNIPLLINLILIVAINLYIGFQSKEIDNAGHIGGLVSGFFLGGLVIVLSFFGIGF